MSTSPAKYAMSEPKQPEPKQSEPKQSESKPTAPTYGEIASLASQLADVGKLTPAWIREKLGQPPKEYDEKALTALKAELDTFVKAWNEANGVEV